MNAGVLAFLAFTIPVLPLLGAAALQLAAMREAALRISPWIPATALLLLPLYGNVVEFPWLLLGARVGLDEAALPLLLLASIAWSVAGLHARQHLEPERQDRFFLFWLLTWTGNLCVFITLDTASFYAAYAMMTFAAYGLVIFNGGSADFHAGRIYLVMAILGEALILAALLAIGSQLGNMALGADQPGMEQLSGHPWVLWCLLAGFGVKTGLLGLHMWLPLAHPRAPVPASAVLSGVILKAGLMGWIRFLPLEQDGYGMAGMVLMIAGLATAFFGVLAGLCQSRAKSLLAYSSVSQMGLISVAIGLALQAPDRAPLLVIVAGIFALHHGLAKALLFLSVDIAARAPGSARALMWWPALALAGAPATSGALAKTALKSGAETGPTGLETALLISSITTTVLMARFLWLAWPREHGRLETTPTSLPWLFGVAAVMTVPWLLASISDPESTLRPFRPTYLLDTTLPVLLGSFIALLTGRLLSSRHLPRIPEGDILALLPGGLPFKPPSLRPQSGKRPPARSTRILEGIERTLGRPTPALIVLLGLLAAAFALLH